MPSDRKPSLITYLAITAALLLAGYVGAYCWLVEPTRIDWSMGFSVAAFYPRVHGEMTPTNFEAYSSSVRRWQRLFAPIHWIDRRIRSHVWEPEETESFLRRMREEEAIEWDGPQRAQPLGGTDS